MYSRTAPQGGAECRAHKVSAKVHTTQPSNAARTKSKHMMVSSAASRAAVKKSRGVQVLLCTFRELYMPGMDVYNRSGVIATSHQTGIHLNNTKPPN